MKRMWINQPSTLQDHHHLHGTNVLAVPSQFGDKYKQVYFLSGPVISQEMPVLALSAGWNKQRVQA